MPFTYSFYTTAFATIHDVIHHMQQLDQALESTELQNLRAFNTTYLIITQSVSAQFDKHYFDSDHRMQVFDILFAKYYFDALYNFVHHQPCAPAWELLFSHCQKKQAYAMAISGTRRQCTCEQ
ncbi:MAG: hypothetical protein KatS3mg087_0411 [Patescibacteria group bacterium]|nr:MAG: hypothetical protein KatS3mg087_0411 [Patescibacteria group bacterium]